MEPIERIDEPDEVANAVLFLGSDDDSRFTGTTLPGDGGYLARYGCFVPSAQEGNRLMQTR